MEYQEIQVGDEILMFPADMSDDDIKTAIGQYLQSQGAGGAAGSAGKPPSSAGAGAPSGPAPGQLDALFDSLYQGATLGFGDEMEAGLLSMLGHFKGDAQQVMGPEGTPDTRSYAELLEFLRGQSETGREEFPITSLAGEMGGALLTGGAGGVAAAGGKTLGQAIPRLAGVGAGEGAIAGAGYSEADTAAGVGTDMALGAGLGGLAGGVLPAAAAGARGLSRYVNPFGPGRFGRRRAAGKTLARDVEQSGLTPGDLEAGFASDPNLVTADLSDQLRQRLSYAAQKSPKVARAAKEMTEERQAGARGRLGGVLGESLGDQSTGAASNKVRRGMSKMAKPLYDEAYATRVQPTPEMWQLLGTPAGRSAVRRVYKKFLNKTDIDAADIPFKENMKGQMVPVGSSVRFWDEFQRVLSDDIGTMGRRPSDARDRRKMRDIVVGGLEKQSPAFRDARALWRGGKEAEEALEMGRRAFAEFVPDLRREHARMSEAARGLFKLGVFEKLDDMISRKGEGDRLAAVFKDAKKREAIRMAIGNDALFTRFLRSLGNEAQMEETWRAVKNAPLIDTSRRVQTMPSMTPSMAVYQSARRGATNVVLDPLERLEMEHLGGALMGRDPSRLLRQGDRTMGGLAGLAGLGAIDPTWAQGLIPSSQPPLPR